jgi:hypothetical protein
MPNCAGFEVMAAGAAALNGRYANVAAGCHLKTADGEDIFHNHCYSRRGTSGVARFLIRTDFHTWQLGIQAASGDVTFYYKVTDPQLYQSHPVALGWAPVGAGVAPAPWLKAPAECQTDVVVEAATTSAPTKAKIGRESFQFSEAAIGGISGAGFAALMVILFFYCGCYTRLVTRRRNFIAQRNLDAGVLSSSEMSHLSMGESGGGGREALRPIKGNAVAPL